MKKNVTRALIETMVRQMIRNMGTSPKRSARYLADMGQNFSKGRFQKDFFTMVQVAFQDEHSVYYDFLRQTVRRVDEDRIMAIGLNIGYESLTVGAKRIREIEERTGEKTPWFLPLPVNGDQFTGEEGYLRRIIRQGLDAGIHTYMFDVTGTPDGILSMAGDYPDCAWLVFTGQNDIASTPDALLTGSDNVMYVVRRDAFTHQTCRRLYDLRLPYSISMRYGAGDIESIENGDFYRYVSRQKGIFAALIPEEDCPVQIRERAWESAKSARRLQRVRTIPWELEQDGSYVSSRITTKPCPVILHRRIDLSLPFTQLFRQNADA